MRQFGAALMVIATAGAAGAAIQSEPVEYEFQGTKMKGVIYYDDAKSDKRPGVMVVHEFWGLDDYAKMRAEMLAKLGYVALACDMYGDGKHTEHAADASKFAGEARANKTVWLGRADAGLKVLKENKFVDPKKLAVIGYCFGGSTAIQVALAGTPDVLAVVSFHGALPTPSVDEVKHVKAKVVVCHGADDGFVTADVVKKFRDAFDRAGVKYTFVAYPGAVHSFTVKGAENKGLKGIAYNKNADEKSWALMRETFEEVFGK
ncbi:MAG TPA: dienelactone hydrolase family protein [Fimbriiglobus sp.]|jgi:dienelactone hydrolase